MKFEYQEWIRFGHDPVLTLDFWELSRSKSKEFYTKVVDAIPERIRQLEGLINERRPGLNWTPSFTEPAFATVVEVFTESVETRPRSRIEIARHRDNRAAIFEMLGEPIREWEATDRTYSIAFDAGLYLASDFQSKEPRMQWKLDTRKSSLLRNQPILQAPNPRRMPPFLTIGPLDEFATSVLRVAGHNPHRFTWIDVYREWMKLFAAYRNNYPP